jgi:hypothetical protein
MVDTYYCPNLKCSYGIGLTEIFKSAEHCPKCGTQARKLSFLDMVRLVEEKKKYQSNPEPLISEDQKNEQLVKNAEATQAVQETVQETPTLPSNVLISPHPEKPENEIMEAIDEDLKRFEVHEESIKKASDETGQNLSEENSRRIIDFELRALIEQNKIMIKQNELVLRSLEKQRPDCAR